jgi:transposase InsO family protein
MSTEIRQHVENCNVCASLQHKQPNQPLFLHDIPERPWQKVATDIFTIKSRNYLITVDYYSQYFEIDFLADTLSETVIHKLKLNFARHGIPDILISDNGPQFSSHDFSKFCNNWNIKYEPISPGNSQANGAAEAAVKIAKQMMKKCNMQNEDPYIALLNLRNTPQEGSNYTPVQRLMGRHTRTLLPTSSKLLKPNFAQDYQQISENLKTKLGEKHNNCRQLAPLKLEDVLRIQPINPANQIWKPATVTKQLSPRAYTVQTKDGREYRRDRHHLRLQNVTKEPIQPNNVDFDNNIQNKNISNDV